MLKQLIISIRALVVLSVLTGVFYPLAITAIAQIAFAHNANGSLLKDDAGTVQGSELIGQPFSDPKYFWSRPSATSPAYNAGASSGSNLGPLHPDLEKAVADRIAALKQADPENTAPVPIDLVTASSSGLDPHVSPAAAQYQAARVARVRGIAIDEVDRLVADHTEGRQLGFLGEPRVNVLKLNLALDALGGSGN